MIRQCFAIWCRSCYTVFPIHVGQIDMCVASSISIELCASKARKKRAQLKSPPKIYPNCKQFKSVMNVGKMGRVKRIWYLSPMRAAKVQASLRIRAVSPEPPLLAHTSSESRGTFRQKARSLAPLNGWACAVEICHDGMLEYTNSLDAAQIWKKKNAPVLLIASYLFSK